MSFPIITIKNYIRRAVTAMDTRFGFNIVAAVNKKLLQPDRLIQGEEIVMRKIDFDASQAAKEFFPLCLQIIADRNRDWFMKDNFQRKSLIIIVRRELRTQEVVIEVFSNYDWERKERREIRSAITVTAEGWFLRREAGNENNA